MHGCAPAVWLRANAPPRKIFADLPRLQLYPVVTLGLATQGPQKLRLQRKAVVHNDRVVKVSSTGMAAWHLSAMLVLQCIVLASDDASGEDGQCNEPGRQQLCSPRARRHNCAASGPGDWFAAE